ncbi:amino acid adenylation domain-containing protein [Phreatobacter sp.]|uniref:amino acid adenylation domain-containing protein n=1 Tax=Phreatobacter sp. TaxID=1966341 RepID=UPI0022C168D3|nr:amino acid adenylation domain-containing protein [Phreatobacter sp.]MCZ8314335.1 amino acid adenylation domain-containing protein [Phreatobacter sp.]
MIEIDKHDIGRSLLQAARRFADRPSLSAVDGRLTYRELFATAASVSSQLIASGLQPGDCVAVLGERTSRPYIGLLGAMLAGCCYVPLNPQFPAERNRLILELSGARALIIDDACAERFHGALGSLDGVRVIRARPGGVEYAGGGMEAMDPDALLPRPAPGADAPLYLLFTSGTTGKPKGVPISHANLASYMVAIHPHVPIGPEDRVLQAVDLTFDLSVHDMMLAWLNGAELCVGPENATLLSPRLIAANAITACLIVPSAGARALDYGLAPPGKMPSLRYSLFAGEALPVSVALQWQQAAPNARIFNLYGPTEGTIHTSYYVFDGNHLPPSKTVPIGYPLGEQRILLAHADGTPASDGDTAEIFLAGPQMTRGYWRAPDLDRDRFVEFGDCRWYRTGDLGRLDPHHGILFAGRADRQLKIRGYRVELQEVEGTLRDVSGSNQVAVIGWPVVADGAADGIAAFIAGAPADADAITAAMRVLLPVYMVPDTVLFVDTLPLNVNGKTDHRALAERLSATAATPSIAPASA